MKKTILLPLFLTICTISFGQSNKKYALVQHFTNTKCSVCAGNNPTYYTNIKPLEADVHHISIHPSVPYNTCGLYLANTAEQETLRNFYGIGGTPTFIINGTQKSLSTVNASVSTAVATKSPISIKVSQTTLNNKLNTTINVNTTELPATGTYVLYVAAVEKNVTFSGGNGETKHYDVFRKMFTSASGQAITLTATGKQTFTFSTDILSTWVATEMNVLAWVQNTTTKEVLNSGGTLDISTASEEIATDTEVIDLFPNPTSNVINFDIKNKDLKIEEISILGLDGKNYSNNVEVNDNQINVQLLSNGIYLFQLRTKENMLYTKKFEKK